MKGKSGGFTLVELLVTMACSALIMFAAMTFLLICMRLDVSAQTTACLLYTSPSPRDA